MQGVTFVLRRELHVPGTMAHLGGAAYNLNATMSHILSRANNIWPFLLKAAVLGMVLATVLSSFSFIGLKALGALATRSLDGESAPTLWDVGKGTFLMCAITIVWHGPFGFLSGALGGAVLHVRSRRIRTFKRLLIECAFFGFLAALVLPLYDVAVAVFILGDIRYLYSITAWIAVPVCCVASGVIFAGAFRKRFLRTAELV